MRLFGALLCGIAVASSATLALARPFRVDDIPNGDKNTCLNCHVDYKPSAQNDFGSDAQTKLVGPAPVSSKHVDWAPLCPLDSDHDGWTNGQELGDPNCTWVAGDKNPTGTVFNPGDPDSHPPPICDNGKLDAGEDCEGAMMSETDCAIVGAGQGALACRADCTFDYSGCSAPPDPNQGPPGGDSTQDGGCSASRAGAAGAASDGSGAALAALLGLALVRRSRLRPRRHQPRAKIGARVEFASSKEGAAP